MSGWKLFKSRLSDDFQFQWKVFGSVIDWIMLVYFIIPMLVFATLIYIDVWLNIGLYWFDFIPLSMVINLLLLLLLSGNFRTFMMDADILFLLDRPKIYHGLRKWAFGYSFVQLLLSTAVLLAIILPVLVQGYGFEILDLLFLYIFFLGYRLTVYTVKKITRQPVLRWLGLILPLYLIAANLAARLPFVWLALIGVVLAFVIIVWQFLTLIPTKRYFLQEAALEKKERVRYVKLILGMSTEIPKTPIKLGKRPLFLRRGQSFFKEQSPENGLFEIVLKGFFRNSVLLGSYLQLVWITLFAILILPIWAKWLLFVIFVGFIQYNAWLKGMFEKMLDDHFFSVVPFDDSIREPVWLRFKRLLVVPAVTLVGVVTVILSVIAIL